MENKEKSFHGEKKGEKEKNVYSTVDSSKSTPATNTRAHTRSLQVARCCAVGVGAEHRVDWFNCATPYSL